MNIIKKKKKPTKIDTKSVIQSLFRKMQIIPLNTLLIQANYCSNLVYMPLRGL